jgi:hypothetical protein
MDTEELEKEFNRIAELPSWQRPIELSVLAKKQKLSIASVREAFSRFFWEWVNARDAKEKESKSVKPTSVSFDKYGSVRR